MNKKRCQDCGGICRWHDGECTKCENKLRRDIKRSEDSDNIFSQEDKIKNHGRGDVGIEYSFDVPLPAKLRGLNFGQLLNKVKDEHNRILKEMVDKFGDTTWT